MRVDRLDHLVLTFCTSKINLHQRGSELEP
jgi:hypothetical protein